MHWPHLWLELFAQERLRESMACAPMPPARRARVRPPPAGWRRALWLVGRGVHGLGRRLEELAVAGQA